MHPAVHRKTVSLTEPVDNATDEDALKTRQAGIKRTGSDPTPGSKEILTLDSSCLVRLAADASALMSDESLVGAIGEELPDLGSNPSTASRTPGVGDDLSRTVVSPESVTDCGSLSKSSSDGDPIGVVSRKRPPTKLKSRRRNILSFPHHISVDELRLIQVKVLSDSLLVSFSRAAEKKKRK